MNLKALDADSTTKYLKAGGEGTELDPLVVEHSDSTAHQLLTSIQEKVVEIAVYTDSLESLLNTLNNYSSALETLLTTANFTQSAIGGFVDQLEGYTDGIESNQATQIARLEAIRDRLPEIGISQTVAVDNFPLIQGIDGTVEISNFPAPVTEVAINNLPATQPVSATALPLPNNASTETTLALVRDRLPNALLNDRLKTDSFVRSMFRKWREDFAGVALNPAAWTVIQTGAGQTITVANSELRITSGITPNSETIIRSVEKFTISFRTWFIASVSQRLANQEYSLEIVDATGQHYATHLLDNTGNNTGSKVITANNGNTIGSTTFSSTNSTVYQIFEIECFPDEINFFSRVTDSVGTRGATVVRTRQIPDPNLEYFVQIRAKNLVNAPSSSNTLSIDAIAVQDIEELTTEITGGRGGTNFNQAIPIFSTGGTCGISGSVSIQNIIVYFTEFSLPLGVDATITATARDINARNLIRGWVFTDVAGTLIIEQSVDNTTFRQTHSFAITGNATVATPFEFKTLSRYARFKYTNGATAQTIFQCVSTHYGIGA